MFFPCFYVELKAIYLKIDVEVGSGTLSGVSGRQNSKWGEKLSLEVQPHHRHPELHSWESGRVKGHLSPLCPLPFSWFPLPPAAKLTGCCSLHIVAQAGPVLLPCSPRHPHLPVPSPQSHSTILVSAPGKARAPCPSGPPPGSFFLLSIWRGLAISQVTTLE